MYGKLFLFFLTPLAESKSEFVSKKEIQSVTYCPSSRLEMIESQWETEILWAYKQPIKPLEWFMPQKKKSALLVDAAASEASHLITIRTQQQEEAQEEEDEEEGLLIGVNCC